MLASVKVAVCQLDTRMGQVDENVVLALSVAERAAASGAQYILFHENMVHEYAANAAELAEPAPGPVTDRFAAFCQRHRVCIGFGMTLRAQPSRPDRSQERPFNAAVFINASGEIAATYAKRNLVRRAGMVAYMEQREGRPIDLAGYDGLVDDEVFQPGADDVLFDWDGVRAGVLICADTSRAEYWKVIAERGATAIFCPFNNPGLRYYHPRILDQVRESGLHFIGANRVGSYPMGLPGRGQSLTADPEGNVLADCGGQINAFAVADLPIRSAECGMQAHR
jgi:predicted amidohydrolase